MYTRKLISLLSLGILLALASAARADDSVKVTLADGASQAWTLARIRQDLAADIKSVEFTSHGEKHAANGVPLVALLKSAGAPVEVKMDPKADPRTKNYNLRLAVVVQGG